VSNLQKLDKQMRLLSPLEARSLDQETFSTTHLTSAQFIQKAGETAARLIIDELPFFKTVLVLAGPGNNGADGIVCGEALARKYLKKVFIWRLDENVQDPLSELLFKVDLVVDALFGVGQDRPLYGKALEWVSLLNQHPRRTKTQFNFQDSHRKAGFLVVSIDTPSGLNSLTGKVFSRENRSGGVSEQPAQPQAVKAHLTLAMQAPKPGFFIHDGPELCGRIRVIRLPYPEPLFKKHSTQFFSFGSTEVRRFLPTINPKAHKRQRGQLIGWVGSDTYPGAAILALGGALASGVGFVRWMRPDQMNLPYAEIVALSRNLKTLEQKVPQFFGLSWLLGSGVEPDRKLQQVIEKLLESRVRRVILDAGAIEAAIHVLKSKNLKAPDSWLWTPHIGELARALRCSASQLEDNRFNGVAQACGYFGGTWLSKGYRTIIKSQRSPFLVSRLGDSRLAKAGSGDVLAGLCAGFTAQGLPPLQAAVLGTVVQALTPNFYEGDAISFLPTDQIRLIPRAIRFLRRRSPL
jgi:NAD(P)H-hydrate epimerase